MRLEVSLPSSPAIVLPPSIMAIAREWSGFRGVVGLLLAQSGEQLAGAVAGLEEFRHAIGYAVSRGVLAPAR